MAMIIAPKNKLFRNKENKKQVYKFLFLKEGESIENFEEVSFKEVFEESKKKENSNIKDN